MTRFRSLLLLFAFILPLAACQRTSDEPLPPSPSVSLKVVEEPELYLHPDIPWDSSIEEVESILGKTLELHLATKVLVIDPVTQESIGDVKDLKIAYLACENALDWDGCSAWAKFTFMNGGNDVTTIKYYFQQPEDDLAGLYDSINTTLLEQYGEPYSTSDHEVQWRVEEAPPDAAPIRFIGSVWSSHVADDSTYVTVDKYVDAEDNTVQVELSYEIDHRKG